jgi:hypothetical protein
MSYAGSDAAPTLRAIEQLALAEGDTDLAWVAAFLYEREDGTTVHGDASGEWTFDENGDLEDIVFFTSPRWMGYGRKAE